MYTYIDTEIKYSPTTLADFIFPTDEVEDVVMDYATGQVRRLLFLHGPSGTGKSALTRLIPDAIESGNAFIRKITASSLNTTEGLNLLENQKKFSVTFLEGNNVMNYCVIEEYEQKLKTAASLKVLLDDYKDVDLTIFTSNHIKQVDTAVLSRCTAIRVPPAPPSKFLPFASDILEKEKVQMDDAYLLTLLEETFNEHADNRKYYQVLSKLINKVNKAKEAA